VVKTPVPEWIRQVVAEAKADVATEQEDERPEDAREAPGGAEDVQVEAIDPAEAEVAGPEGPGEVEGTDETTPAPTRTPRRLEFAARAGPLRAFLTSLDIVADEAKVVVSADGWRVRTVDPAHVAMVEAHLGDFVDAFERVDGRREGIAGEVPMGLDVRNLLAVVKKAKRDEVVRLAADLPNDEGRDELTLEVGPMRRVMGLRDPEEFPDPKVPKLDLPAWVRIRPAALLEAARAASEFTDHVRLTATPDRLNVSGEGEYDRLSVDFRDGEGAEVRAGDRSSSLFALDYLTSFLKAVKDVEAIDLRLGTDYPLRVDWEDDGVRGTYLLAPRIEPE